jgi:pimeloyl-ACP methyl ester carboxylesterase
MEEWRAMEPVRHTLRANGLDHSVLEWPGVGDDVALLLHGFMDAAGTWSTVAAKLAGAGLRVLAPDMRGFGEAPRAPRGGYYHFPDYIADVALLLDLATRADERLFVVGHSMGGTVATYLAGALAIPGTGSASPPLGRVTKLAILEGAGPPDSTHDVAPERMRAWIDDLRSGRHDAEKSMGTLDDALTRLARSHPRVDREVLRALLPHLVREIAPGKYAWRADPLHRTRSPFPFFASSYVAFARRVTCPVLFVDGGPTGFHAPDESARLAAFARLERVELPDAGHMMHWTRPAELTTHLVEFWRKPLEK